ncbi:MAG: thiolase family protein [Sulfitobacter sp.]
MRHSVLLSARRTPVVPRNGAFSHLSIEDLAKPVLLAAMTDAGLSPQDINELIVANALGGGGNPARIVALNAGLPERVAGLSIDRQCVGGLDALILGDALIRAGQCDVVIAGGVESYSRRPLRYRTFADGRAPLLYDQAQFTPWSDQDPNMAEAANRLATDLGIEKSEQDAWAIRSHANAQRYTAKEPTPEIVSLEGLTHDQFTRELTLRHCNRATVVDGSITAANMAVAADAAAFVVMSSRGFAQRKGLRGVEFIAGATIGDNPVLPGLAPVLAIKQVLERAGVSTRDISAVEIMEAFAVQAIACVQGADIPEKIVNACGGALARGHPIGASGAILAVMLFHQLSKNKGFGLAGIAAAGGLGSAAVFQAR